MATATFDFGNPAIVVCGLGNDFGSFQQFTQGVEFHLLFTGTQIELLATDDSSWRVTIDGGAPSDVVGASGYTVLATGLTDALHTVAVRHIGGQTFVYESGMLRVTGTLPSIAGDPDFLYYQIESVSQNYLRFDGALNARTNARVPVAYNGGGAVTFYTDGESVELFGYCGSKLYVIRDGEPLTNVTLSTGDNRFATLLSGLDTSQVHKYEVLSVSGLYWQPMGIRIIGGNGLSIAQTLPDRPQVYVFGDSIVGLGLDFASFPILMAIQYDLGIAWVSNSGFTLGSTNIEPSGNLPMPDYLVSEGGTNNFGTGGTAEELYDQATAKISQYQALWPGVEQRYMAILLRQADEEGSTVEPFRQAIRDAVTDAGLASVQPIECKDWCVISDFYDGLHPTYPGGPGSEDGVGTVKISDALAIALGLASAQAPDNLQWNQSIAPEALTQYEHWHTPGLGEEFKFVTPIGIGEVYPQQPINGRAYRAVAVARGVRDVAYFEGQGL
jgi:hypothetical protein